jgi:hypothetical protein
MSISNPTINVLGTKEALTAFPQQNMTTETNQPTDSTQNAAYAAKSISICNFSRLRSKQHKATKLSNPKEETQRDILPKEEQMKCLQNPHNRKQAR